MSLPQKPIIINCLSFDAAMRCGRENYMYLEISTAFHSTHGLQAAKVGRLGGGGGGGEE